MFQVKVTEKSGKVWNFDLVDGESVEVWINSTGGAPWEHFGTIPLTEALVQVAVLMGNAKK